MFPVSITRYNHFYHRSFNRKPNLNFHFPKKTDSSHLSTKMTVSSRLKSFLLKPLYPYQTGAYAAAEHLLVAAKTKEGSKRTQPKSGTGTCPHSRALPLFSGQCRSLLLFCCAERGLRVGRLIWTLWCLTVGWS